MNERQHATEMLMTSNGCRGSSFASEASTVAYLSRRIARLTSECRVAMGSLRIKVAFATVLAWCALPLILSRVAAQKSAHSSSVQQKVDQADTKLNNESLLDTHGIVCTL